MNEGDFEGVCPFCKSGNIDVNENTEIIWGNNDEGETEETWHCNDCKNTFYTTARIEIVYRRFKFYLMCPYCQSGNDELKPHASSEGIIWYWCDSCNREFGIHPEKWYKEMIE